RVGNGDLAAALCVAQRPRVGSGRSRPDLERPLRRHPCHGTAARTHGDHVDHRDLGRVDPHRPLGSQRGLAAHHDRHIRGRPAPTPVAAPPPPRLSTWSTPAFWAIMAAPTAPAAGPLSPVLIGWLITCAAVTPPPLEVITCNGSPPLLPRVSAAGVRCPAVVP